METNRQARQKDITKNKIRIMTTAEFIKMLQNADPSGTAHVRMEGGVPYMAEHKPGYWDGPYSYIDEEGRYVQTSQGSKVDIYCKDSSQYVWDNEMDWNSFQEDPEIAWERLKSLFVFDYNNYAIPEQRQERIDRFFKGLKEDFDEYVAYSASSNQKYLDEVITKYNAGWRYFQKKDCKYRFYDWVIMTPVGTNDGANWATTGPILLSNKFRSIDRGEYLEFVLKEDEIAENRPMPNFSKKGKMSWIKRIFG